MKNKIDIFSPPILVVAILVFLIMGYIGSFNYRFEDPLKLEVILTVIFSCAVFIVGFLIVKYKINIIQFSFTWRNTSFQQCFKIKCNNRYLESCLSFIFNYN